MTPLPIDPLLPEIIRILRGEGSLVLEAPPGAGKTTRVPRALLDAGLLAQGEVIVLEPRRLAARMAARRVADELAEQPGARVGYQVRFEDVSSPATRIRFMTEGVLTRRLVADPKLAGVSAVLLDEFHERHLQGDVGLALLQRLRRTTRPELRLGVMSATLSTGPVARYLGDASTVRSEGRQYEVAIDYLERSSQKHLSEQIAGAIHRLLATQLDGDVLVFLPGAEEIRRSMESCREVAQANDLVLLPLHGELSPEDQDRAVRRWPNRKVILATNVAETSVTIDGIVAVIDSGVARVARHSPWSGLPQLRIAPVSKASATQRAGRAGRTRPGRCLRLYTRADFDTRPEFEEPEIRRADLAQIALELHSARIDPTELSWFEPPPAASLGAAEDLLRSLGAIDATRSVTELGRRMARVPVHPRLARVALEADKRGAGREGALLAAILGERDLRAMTLDRRRSAPMTGDSDPLESLELFLEAESRNLSQDAIRSIGLDARAVRSVDRARQQIVRAVGARSSLTSWKETEVALKIAILAGFPDRVAQRRTAGRSDLVFANGGSGQLGDSSGVRNAPLVVVVDADERRAEGGSRVGGVVVRSASAIEADWLIDVVPDELAESVDLVWNDSLERVDALSRFKLGALTLDESAARNPDPAAVAALLFEKARGAGPRAFCDQEKLERLLARVAFIARSFPETGVQAPSPGLLEKALAEACAGRRSFAELREAGLVDVIGAELGAGSQLARLAPESLTLPGGRRVSVHYEEGKPPWIESRLQDFFGLATGPTLGGRVPLVLHLLAPNHRAVQVTTDLSGFWSRHYPAIRRELMRHYPRHSWPEDPLTASPPVPKSR
jgi:ATP-dependent helicase HrpB